MVMARDLTGVVNTQYSVLMMCCRIVHLKLYNIVSQSSQQIQLKRENNKNKK